jgi:nucleotide-binding universal stress UspA family protein
MKQILVAVDTHPHAVKIVDSAIEMAELMSAKILLIYVQQATAVPGGYTDEHGDALPEHWYEDQFQRAMRPLFKRMDAAGVKYEGVCKVGNPVDQILKTAKSKQADYIVVGARGLSNLRRLKAISSVSRNVIEKSDIPVVSIP